MTPKPFDSLSMGTGIQVNKIFGVVGSIVKYVIKICMVCQFVVDLSTVRTENTTGQAVLMELEQRQHPIILFLSSQIPTFHRLPSLRPLLNFGAPAKNDSSISTTFPNPPSFGMLFSFDNQHKIRQQCGQSLC